MQAHDTVAVQDLAEESVAQYLGETVKLVRLEKTRDTPLVRHRRLVPLFFRRLFFYRVCIRRTAFSHSFSCESCKSELQKAKAKHEKQTNKQFQI